jgi:hypothetical protein
MWKREDWGSKTTLEFVLDYLCLKNYIVITRSGKDQETMQHSARFNQILPTEAPRAQLAWRRLIE